MADSHSVEGHLNLRPAEYDQLIRKLVPAYAQMRRVQLELLALGVSPSGGLVLDLGGGTGALAAAIAERFSGVMVQVWDLDPGMLAIARSAARLSAIGCSSWSDLSPGRCPLAMQWRPVSRCITSRKWR